MPKPVYKDIYIAIKQGKIRVNQRSPVEHRFWKRVNKEGSTPKHVPELGPCWIWLQFNALSKPTEGYGYFGVNGQAEYAHRFSFTLHRGRIPGDMQVCHKCDNPQCVNPDHLFLGTQKDNIFDMHQKGRQSTPEQRGHQGEDNGRAILSEEDVMLILKLYHSRENKRDSIHESSPYSQNKLAKMFGVSSYAIYAIIHGINWKPIQAS